MGANSNGTPTSLGIPTLSPSQDNLNALGINEITQSVDSKISGRMFAPLAPSNLQVVKWSTSSGAWIADFVDPAELKQSGATNGQALVWNTGSGKWVPTTVGALARKTTPKVVNTSVAPTDLLNGEVTIAAGVMGATGILRLTAWGDWLQNIGTNQVPPRIQLLFGGTTIFDTGASTGANASSAVRHDWSVEAIIANDTAATQTAKISGKFVYGAAGSAASAVFTTGTGWLVNDGVNFMQTLSGSNSGLAVNTALSAALVLNVINANAGANYETKLFGAMVELL